MRAGAVVMSFPLGGRRMWMLSKWKGSLSSLPVERPRLPVCDLSFVKEIRLLPLDSYFSELGEESTSDGLRGGGV